MVLVLGLSVPVTFTRLAANFAGAFWSLRAYTVLPSNKAYWLEPLTHMATHFSGGWLPIISCDLPHMVSVMTPVKVWSAARRGKERNENRIRRFMITP